jgi:hypothetical protein
MSSVVVLMIPTVVLACICDELTSLACDSMMLHTDAAMLQRPLLSRARPPSQARSLHQIISTRAQHASLAVPAHDPGV